VTWGGGGGIRFKESGLHIGRLGRVLLSVLHKSIGYPSPSNFISLSFLRCNMSFGEDGCLESMEELC
jgi:hypothetical protein